VASPLRFFFFFFFINDGLILLDFAAPLFLPLWKDDLLQI